ncbi:MAG: type IV secretory system conjugative DNA transfer family protein [Saprospiraceae bacterium]
MLSKRLLYERLYEAILNKIFQTLYTLIGVSGKAQEDNLTFGYTTPVKIQDGIAEAMDIWVNAIDNLLIETDMEEESYAKLWMIRGLTFPEFNLIFTASIEEREYRDYRGFIFLKLRDKVDRDYFTARYKNEMPTYEAILQARGIPILKELTRMRMPIYFPVSTLEKHFYLTGGTGSGKSELIKLVIYELQRSNAAKRDRGIVLIDPHGDISSECLGFIMNAKQRDRIIYVNPFINRELKVEQKYTPVINPFIIKDKSNDSINLMTQELTSALLEILQDATLSFQMELLLTMCIAVVLRMPDADIRHLIRFMDDNQNADLIQLGLQSPFDVHREFFRSKFKLGEYRQTKISIMTRLTNLLAMEEFYRLISGRSTIDIEKAMDSGQVMLFNLAQGRMSERVSSAYGRLIVAYMQGLSRKRVDVKKEERMPVFLIIDECQYYISPSIEEILTGSRKFKLFLFLAQQIVGHKMSTDMEKIVMGNTAIKMMGKNEASSYEAFSKNTGIPTEELQKLEDFTFYVHNRQDKATKRSFQFLSPPFLVDQTSEFYMSAEARKHLLWWFVNESGYYVKVSPTNPPDGDSKDNDDDLPLSPAFPEF